MTFVRFEKEKGPAVDSVDPNLNPFFAHNGKLLMYHGWADPGVPPQKHRRLFQQCEPRPSARRLPRTCGSSWSLAWDIAAAAMAPMNSMPLRHLSSGWKNLRRRIALRLHASVTAKWIARARCARIRKSLSIAARAVPTRAPTSVASSLLAHHVNHVAVVLRADELADFLASRQIRDLLEGPRARQYARIVHGYRLFEVP